MPLIKWRDSYSVGVEKFDEEHKVLLELINEMFIVVRDHKTVDHLEVMINKLIKYTKEHFSDEEEGMAEINYPHLDDHKQIHAKLLSEVTAYKKRIKHNDEEAIQGFYVFLRDWLMTHIVEEDMQYKPFFADAVPSA
jgi:hemerythrin-like metal-binding protein